LSKNEAAVSEGIFPNKKHEGLLDTEEMMLCLRITSSTRGTKTVVVVPKTCFVIDIFCTLCFFSVCSKISSVDASPDWQPNRARTDQSSTTRYTEFCLSIGLVESSIARSAVHVPNTDHEERCATRAEYPMLWAQGIYIYSSKRQAR
jgi:hypothetical protein